jgi:hypothetical protein
MKRIYLYEASDKKQGMSFQEVIDVMCLHNPDKAESGQISVKFVNGWRGQPIKIEITEEW